MKGLTRLMLEQVIFTKRYSDAIAPPTPCHQLKMMSYSRKIVQYFWHFPATTKQ